MIGGTVSHDQILHKFSHDTGQLAHIKRHAEFLQLAKLLRGERQWIQNDGKKSSGSANQP